MDPKVATDGQDKPSEPVSTNDLLNGDTRAEVVTWEEKNSNQIDNQHLVPPHGEETSSSIQRIGVDHDDGDRGDSCTPQTPSFRKKKRGKLLHRGRRIHHRDFVRTLGTSKPMPSRERTWRTFLESLSCCCYPCAGATQVSNQFRIPPRKEYLWIPLRFIHTITEGAVVSSTLFHYRTSFMNSFLVFVVQYFILVFLFGFWVRGFADQLYKETGEECLPGFDYEHPDELHHNFNAAFELSWNTFATVGYGVISVPATARCTKMRILLASEAFVGILYSGFCGAIIMAKITRKLVDAPVIFTSSVCLQYGEKIESNSPNGSGMALPKSLAKTPGELRSGRQGEDVEMSTFPFLEFRVVNKNGNQKDSEIMYATIDCTVKIFKLMDGFHSPLDTELGTATWTGDTVPKVRRRFRQASLTPGTNALFGKGAWYFRHTLDHNSPFLRRKVSRQLERFGGWPTSWNNPEEMRSKLNPNIFEFDLIFTGSSNQTANDVFKAQSFKLEDIYIGWQFIAIAYLEDYSGIDKIAFREEDDSRSWNVDLSLIHDIIPQLHHSLGLHEPLGSRMAEDNIVQFVRDQAGIPKEEEDED